MNDPIKIYTDGSSLGNPGHGGYAAILTYQGHERELTAGFRVTTNNRMELLAVIKGLEAIKKPRQEVIIYSDSKYVVNAVMQRWVMGWEKKGFEKKKNADLWKRFLTVYRHHNVKMAWIEAHAGHHYNERCDQLAKKAASQGPWQVDVAYEDLVSTSSL